jgi:uncharacterized membrane protein HdeD (DUF308 family)
MPLPASWLALALFTPREDYLGYGGLLIALTVFILLLACGIILAITSLRRRERPTLFTLAGLLGNAAALIWIFANKPD